MCVLLNIHNKIKITDGAFDEVSKVSGRLALDENAGMSTTELIAAAFVNGRLDLLPHGDTDFRRDIIRLGRDWSHAAIEVIFSHWMREMNLEEANPLCPSGDQRIFTRPKRA